MEQYNKLMQWSTVFLVVFALAMAGLLSFMGKRATIKVTEVSQDQVTDSVGIQTGDEEVEEKKILVVQKTAVKDRIEIPLDGTVNSTDITAQNDYLDGQIQVVIPKATTAFYEALAVTADPKQVTDASYFITEDDVHMLFHMDNVYDITTEYEKNMLSIVLEKPYITYEKIVVIDPADSESRDMWQIACDVRDTLDANEVKVYISRTEQSETDSDRTVALADAVRADMMIRIEPGEADDSSYFGTKVLFNDKYFTPELSSAVLSDLVEREVTKAISGKALGIQAEAETHDLLSKTTVPTAVLIPGYITHDIEKSLLGQEQYQKKIASGICSAVLQAYERIYADNE